MGNDTVALEALTPAPVGGWCGLSRALWLALSSPLAAAPRARTARTPLGVLVSPGANLLGSVLRPSGDSASQQIKTATQLGEGPEMPTPRLLGQE